MEKFVHRSNMTVFLDRYCILQWSDNRLTLELHPPTVLVSNAKKFISLTPFQGMRIATLRFQPVHVGLLPRSDEFLQNFDEACAVLKRYRITCRDINIMYVCETLIEHCRALFKLLKPLNIALGSQASNRFQSIYALGNW